MGCAIVARINHEITDLRVKKIIIIITIIIITTNIIIIIIIITIITISKLEEDKFFIFDITMFYWTSIRRRLFFVLCLFLCSNRLLLIILQLRTPLISPNISLSKVPNFLWLPLMWIHFSQTCYLMKLLKYWNYLNLVKRFQALRNNKF